MLFYLLVSISLHSSPLCLHLGRGGKGERVGTLEWPLPTGTIVVTVFYLVELSHAVIFNYKRLHFYEYRRWITLLSHEKYVWSDDLIFFWTILIGSTCLFERGNGKPQSFSGRASGRGIRRSDVLFLKRSWNDDNTYF